MVAPVPHTWTAGDDATSAALQTLTDSILHLQGSATSGGAKKPVASLRQTVTMNVLTGAWTALAMDTEDADYDASHSTLTNTTRFTALTTGWHLALGVFAIGSNATGRRLVGIRKNGTGGGNPTDGRQDVPAAASVQVFQCWAPVFLTAGVDYIETVGFQDSTVTLATSVGTTDAQSRLVVWWLSN